MHTWTKRAAALAGTAGVAALLVGAMTPAMGATPGKPGNSGGSGSSASNPYDPATGHAYRRGVVPTRGQQQEMQRYAGTATGTETLSYGGGVDGIGVTSGTPKVYLVFWGSQWGTQTTTNGISTFSNDPDSGAPYIQNLFKGLGTDNEQWSGTMTQYCDGAGVATGATSCPSGSAHIGYPAGGALAGVWYDNSAPTPAASTGHQIAAEAVTAAGHFGNTTGASNRYAQYVILSPTGANPDGYQTGGFCAWHDYNGDTTLNGGAATSNYGDIAFTNMPYVMDEGASCGQDFVNANGTDDGYSIVSGHEYAETITDQNPAGGWTNHTSSSYRGQENGDECAWKSPGTAGGAANVVTAGGTFAMQSTWSNDTNTCAISHTIVTGGPATNDFSMGVSPSGGTVPAGQQITAAVSTAVTSGAAQTVSLTTSSLPTGVTVSFNPASVTAGAGSTMTVTTTTATVPSTYSITVYGTGTTASHSTTYSLTVASTGGSGTNAITNGGFETGNSSGWTTSGVTSVESARSHSGGYAAEAGASSATNGSSSFTQTFTAKSGNSTLTFWYYVTCNDTVRYDWATATLKDSSSSKTSTVLAKTCVANSGWKPVTVNITAGHTYTLTLINHDDNNASDPTFTTFDDVSTQ